MGVPFVIERMVIADRAAAEQGAHPGQPVFSPPFELDGSEHWWIPVWKTLALYFDVYQVKKPKKVVTYLHSQSQSQGLKLADEDHRKLVRALEKMGKDYGYEVHVFSSSAEESDWSNRMSAIVQSSVSQAPIACDASIFHAHLMSKVVLGVTGGHLADGVFMKPSPQTTLMEFFPEETFSRDQLLAVHSLGMHYVAWWGSKSVTLS